MSAVNAKLRRGEGRYFHWCPGCNRWHALPDAGWSFNGNTDCPTFSPSFRHTWGDNKVCHYILTNGILNFCGDSTHELAGKAVPLPDFPVAQAERWGL